MKHTECKDCKLSNGDCGNHFKMDGTTNFDIASLSACDQYGNCMFFKSKANTSGDLISREALKKAFREWTGDSDTLVYAHTIYSLIDNAPTVETSKIEHKAYNDGFKDGVEQGIKLSERPTGKWIPVKTRELTEEEKEEYPDCTFMYDCKLPDDGEDVLVTTWAGNVSVDTFCHDDGCYFEYGCDEGDVIAWQPLPEPYKGDAE